MSEPIEKIGGIGIGSDHNSGQVYWFKCWKILVYKFKSEYVRVMQVASDNYLCDYRFFSDSGFHFSRLSEIDPNMTFVWHW